MVAVLLVGGIGLLLAGLLAIGFGIPVKEFSFGNTLIVSGVVAACTGVMMLGLWIAVLELKNIARRFGIPLDSRVGTTPPPGSGASRAPEDGGFLFSRDQPAPENPGHAAPTPWHDETDPRDREPAASDEPGEAAPAVRPRRNLLFSSTSRKERERAQARSGEPTAVDLDLDFASPVVPPLAEPGEPPPATFDDTWPKPERARIADAPLQRRGGRTPSTFPEAGAGADHDRPAARSEDRPPVTVLKSGVVDGMAYSLYSDGSIEAQMPEGMMRFASIDELRSHLDRRS